MGIVGSLLVLFSLIDYDRVQTAPDPVVGVLLNTALLAAGVFSVVLARRLLWPAARSSLLSRRGWRIAAGVFMLLGTVTAVAAARHEATMSAAIALSINAAVAWLCLRASIQSARLPSE
jgi:hypothetical protein